MSPSADDTRVNLCCPHVSEVQAGPQGVDDVLGEVRVVRVPHQADGDDLGAVEEDASHPQLLTALTLKRKRRSSERRTAECELVTRGQKVSYGTVPQVAHAGVPQQLAEHPWSGLLPRLQHLHSLVTEEEEEEELCVT